MFTDRRGLVEFPVRGSVVYCVWVIYFDSYVGL